MRASPRAALLLVACASGAACSPRAHAPDRAPIGLSSGEASRSRDGERAPDGGPEDTLPTLAALAARGPLVAPGMREVAKGEPSGDLMRADVVRAESRDLCARVAFVATAPLTARLEDAAGTALAQVSATDAGTLGDRGPVCVRKGDVIRVRFDAPRATRVRWVAWTSP